MKNMKDALDAFITGMAFIAGIAGIVVGARVVDKKEGEAFKAGYRIDDLSYNSAVMKVVGTEKAADIRQEKLKMEREMLNTMNNGKITTKQFNKIYDANFMEKH